MSFSTTLSNFLPFLFQQPAQLDAVSDSVAQGQKTRALNTNPSHIPRDLQIRRFLKNAFHKTSTPTDASALRPITLEEIQANAPFEKIRHENLRRMESHLSGIEKNGLLDPAKLNEALSHFTAAAYQKLDKLYEAKFQQEDTNREPGQLLAQHDQKKGEIAASLKKKCRDMGWQLPEDVGNVQWEAGKGPLLCKKGLSIHTLQLDKAGIAEGGYGSVSLFKNENGDKLIGKISKNAVRDIYGNIEDDLGEELEAYQHIYAKAGTHPNLVNVYGIAEVPVHNGNSARTMLMDFVPGSTGTKTFDALKQAYRSGKISHAEYFGAMQFIGRRLLDVTEHLGKAGIVHNDIKPKNIMINEKTGEPIVLDLGVWCISDESVMARGTHPYMSAEARKGVAMLVDERSDVATIGATLLDGMEGYEHGATVDSNGQKCFAHQGLKHDAKVKKDKLGNAKRTRGTYGIETAWTKFTQATLEKDKSKRPFSKAAKDLPFLSDSLLDDDSAKKVIKKVLFLSTQEEKKPEAMRWKTPKTSPTVSKELFDQTAKTIDAVFKNPNLSDYAKLHRFKKTDATLKTLLNRGGLNGIRGTIEQEANQRANDLLRQTPWFDKASEIAKDIVTDLPSFAVKSGVDENGVRLKAEDTKINYSKQAWAEWTRKELSSYISIDDLKKYVANAEAFLSDASTLRSSDINLPDKMAMIEERVFASRKLIELDKEASAEMRKKNGNSPKPISVRELRGHETRMNAMHLKNQKLQKRTSDLIHDSLWFGKALKSVKSKRVSGGNTKKTRLEQMCEVLGSGMPVDSLRDYLEGYGKHADLLLRDVKAIETSADPDWQRQLKTIREIVSDLREFKELNI